MDLSLLLNAEPDVFRIGARADSGTTAARQDASALPYTTISPRAVLPPVTPELNPSSNAYLYGSLSAPAPTRDSKPSTYSPVLPPLTPKRDMRLPPLSHSSVSPDGSDAKPPMNLLNFLPQHASSWHKTLPTSPVSRPATPPTPLAIPTAGADGVVIGVGTKRRELRAVGQAHRDRQRDDLDALADCVSDLQRTNNALYNECMRMMRGRDARPLQLRALLRAEVNASYSCAGLHPVSDVNAARLGVRYLTGAMALVLLEYVASRRNLVHVARRPRVAELTCPDSSVYDIVLQRGVAQIRAEANRLSALQNMSSEDWVTEILSSLSKIHEQWSVDETESCVDATAARAAKANLYTNGGAFAGRRRTKKCHRCGMERSAGSGHPRGFCKLEESNSKSTNSNPRMTDDDDD